MSYVNIITGVYQRKLFAWVLRVILMVSNVREVTQYCMKSVYYDEERWIVSNVREVTQYFLEILWYKGNNSVFYRNSLI